MVGTNVWYDFNNSIQESSLMDALRNFIRFLGFEGFRINGPSRGLGDKLSDEILTAEVLGFNDRRIFLSVLNGWSGLRGKYVITDKDCNILDVIMFKADCLDWIEEDEK